jgi:hypothetical protein
MNSSAFLIFSNLILVLTSSGAFTLTFQSFHLGLGLHGLYRINLCLSYDEHTPS